MKLIVSANKLYKRSFIPFSFNEKRGIVGIVYKNYEFEGEEVSSVPNPALGKWYRDKEGYFYWGGALDITNTTAKVTAKKITTNYNQLINLPIEIKNNKGINVVVGIIDTGAWIHDCYKNNLLDGYNASDGSSDFQDKSYSGHGTLIAGLIAGEEISESEIIGVAPSCKLLIAKATVLDSFSEVDYIYKCFNWLINISTIKPDIINCSFDFSAGVRKDEFAALFETAKTKGILLVGAGQDNEGLHNELYYPAKHPSFIAVGSASKDDLATIEQINKKIKYIVPDIKYHTTAKYNLYSNDSGSSFSAALVSGALALIISHLKRNNNYKNNAIEILDDYITQTISTANYSSLPLIYKLT